VLSAWLATGEEEPQVWEDHRATPRRKAYAEVRPRVEGASRKEEEVEAWRAAEAAMRQASRQSSSWWRVPQSELVVPVL